MHTQGVGNVTQNKKNPSFSVVMNEKLQLVEVMIRLQIYAGPVSCSLEVELLLLILNNTVRLFIFILNGEWWRRC